ncbi:MAG: hypothetical protein LBK56_12240 [Gracilibacteraceae bacterium]|jgi:hypothetical protein|nr:hypothetical protein [Gracilibacteraceae bacterium]
MEINIAYIFRQLKKSERWLDVLRGIEGGTLDIGSRTPTAFPGWVTLEVLSGGFATGKALAEGPLAEDEIALLQQIGADDVSDAPAGRQAIARRLLSESGLAELRSLLETGEYRADIPEDTAFLTVAWLLTNGYEKEALAVTKAILPFAGRLRLLPKKAPAEDLHAEKLFRFSASETKARLRGRKPDPRIEAQREALAVWLPFTDKTVALWARTKDEHGWEAEAKSLLAEYDLLCARYTRCRKYRDPQELLCILLQAARDALSGDPDRRGDARARYAVGCFEKKYGPFGGEKHRALRENQARVAGLPAYSALAALVADRLPAAGTGIGGETVKRLLEPVTPAEAGRGAAAGTKIPDVVARVAKAALAGSMEELIENGVVGSPDTMAALAAQITAGAYGRSFADPALGALQAKTYRAFLGRRSLLLVDLQAQTRFRELPWVKAIPAAHGRTDWQKGVARALGANCADHFPGAIIPNVLIAQMNDMYAMADAGRPFVAELAADIFMGKLTKTFDHAAASAGRMLRGSLYERYFGLEYGPFLEACQKSEEPVLIDFAAAHRARGAMPDRSRVVENGALIERVMLYTTHNLATLLAEGAILQRSFDALAADALRQSLRLLDIAAKSSRGLRVLKNAAYAWRQALFFLSLASPAGAERFFDLETEAHRELFAGLRYVMAGGSLDDADSPARRFLGWR